MQGLVAHVVADSNKLLVTVRDREVDARYFENVLRRNQLEVRRGSVEDEFHRGRRQGAFGFRRGSRLSSASNPKTEADKGREKIEAQCTDASSPRGIS